MIDNIKVVVNNGDLKEFEVEEAIEYIVQLYSDKIGAINTHPNIVCTTSKNAYDVMDKSDILQDVRRYLKDGFKQYANSLEEVGVLKVELQGLVKYLNNCESIRLEVKCREKVNYCTYLTLCDMVVYKYDRGSLREEFDKFIALNKFNKEQIDYINAYFEEESYSNPGFLSLERFKEVLSCIIYNMSINGLVDYIGLSIDTLSEDLSSDIKEYVCADEILQLFRDKVKIEKLDNGYDISIFGCTPKSVRYVVGLVEV